MKMRSRGNPAKETNKHNVLVFGGAGMDWSALDLQGSPFPHWKMKRTRLVAKACADMYRVGKPTVLSVAEYDSASSFTKEMKDAFSEVVKDHRSGILSEAYLKLKLLADSTGGDFMYATTNVFKMHRDLNLPNVVELHGNIWSERDVRVLETINGETKSIMKKLSAITLSGEPIPAKKWKRMEDFVSRKEKLVIVVVGSSRAAWSTELVSLIGETSNEKEVFFINVNRDHIPKNVREEYIFEMDTADGLEEVINYVTSAQSKTGRGSSMDGLVSSTTKDGDFEATSDEGEGEAGSGPGGEEEEEEEVKPAPTRKRARSGPGPKAKAARGDI